MPNFTAGTSFGVNDTVTNTKLNALIADATINPECALSINSGTIGTLSCTRGTIGTFNSTTGTIASLYSTNATAATLNVTAGLVTNTAYATSGTIASFNSTSGTIQTLTASTLAGTLTGGTYSGTFSGSLGTSCNFTAGTIGNFTGTSNATIAGLSVGTGGGGSFNTAFGVNCLGSSTSAASYNSAYGHSALRSNTSGAENASSGMYSLYSNTTGGSNTAIGFQSQYSGSTLSFNTSVGNLALYLNTTGTGRNTAVGYESLYLDSGYSNVSALGANTSVTGSNQVQLGDSATTTYVYNTVQSRSDIRDKADVRDTILGLEFVNSLRPVDFKWDMREDYRTSSTEAPHELSDITHDGSKKRNRYHHGLIAQEVKEVLDKNGIDFGGFQDHKISGGDDVLSIGYNELIAPMIKAIQQLSAKVDSLEAQLASK